MAQWAKNPSSIQEEAGLIPALAQWVKDLVSLLGEATLQLRSGVAVVLV